MVFRTAGAIATVLIGVTGQALAQYYPPPQPDPRQPLPPTVIADELPPLNAPVVQGDLLPPVGVGPAYQPPPGARYQQGTAAYHRRSRPGLRECAAARLRAGPNGRLLRLAWRHSARPTRFGQTGCNSGGGDAITAAEAW